MHLRVIVTFSEEYHVKKVKTFQKKIFKSNNMFCVCVCVLLLFWGCLCVCCLLLFWGCLCVFVVVVVLGGAVFISARAKVIELRLSIS